MVLAGGVQRGDLLDDLGVGRGGGVGGVSSLRVLCPRVIARGDVRVRDLEAGGVAEGEDLARAEAVDFGGDVFAVVSGEQRHGRAALHGGLGGGELVGVVTVGDDQCVGLLEEAGGDLQAAAVGVCDGLGTVGLQGVFLVLCPGGGGGVFLILFGGVSARGQRKANGDCGGYRGDSGKQDSCPPSGVGSCWEVCAGHGSHAMRNRPFLKEKATVSTEYSKLGRHPASTGAGVSLYPLTQERDAERCSCVISRDRNARRSGPRQLRADGRASAVDKT